MSDSAKENHLPSSISPLSVEHGTPHIGGDGIPEGSCLLCGHRRPFSTWIWATATLAVGVCQQCRDVAARTEAFQASLTTAQQEAQKVGSHGNQSLSEASGSAQSEALKKHPQPVDDLTDTGGSDQDNRPFADRWELKPETTPEP